MAGTTARCKTSDTCLRYCLNLLTCRNSGLKAMSGVEQAQWMAIDVGQLLMLSSEDAKAAVREGRRILALMTSFVFALARALALAQEPAFSCAAQDA